MQYYRMIGRVNLLCDVDVEIQAESAEDAVFKLCEEVQMGQHPLIFESHELDIDPEE